MKKKNIENAVIPNSIFNRIGLSGRGYPFKDKAVANMYYIMQWFNRTLNMFTWSGLDDVKRPYNEIFQQMNGYCVLLNCEGKYYLTPARFGGECDIYYLPKEVIVANPWASNIDDFNGVHTINEDCVLLKNDSTMCGIYPIINRYTTMLVENDISLQNCDILARIVALLSVENDKDKKEADIYLQKIIDGEFGIFGSGSNWKDEKGIIAQPISNTSSAIMQELIEFEQYIKGALAHELGINYSFNMKREALNTAESELNNEYLIPLIEDMLACRKEFCENVKNVFGIDIDVELNSVWATNEKENTAEAEILENKIEELNEEPGETETSDIEEPDETVESEKIETEVNENDA